MGGSSKSAPKAPDPVATAGAQTGMNIGTAIAQGAMNNVNQITPYGSLNYSQSGTYQHIDPLTGKTYDIPQYTATQTLSKGQQQLYDNQLGAQTSLAALAGQQADRLGNILGGPVDLSKAPSVGRPNLQMIGGSPFIQDKIGGSNAGDITRSYGDEAGYADQRQRVEDALMQRMSPSLEADRARLSAQLANSGIQMGSEAYDREMRNVGTRENDARLGAILGAGEEQSRLAGLDRDRASFENAAQTQQFGQNLQRTAFGNDARQNAFNNRMAATGYNNQLRQQQFGNDQSLRNNYLNEQYAARNQPINEIAALLGTGQVQNPSFVNTGGNNIANVDYAGLVNQNYNQRLAQWQQGQSTLGSILGTGASAMMMMSDRRLKTDVSFLGMLRDLPIYAYRYIWGGPVQVGVMAQDMLTLRPDAVVPVGGWLAVDYGRL